MNPEKEKEKKSYLPNVENLPSIKRFEEEVKKAEDELQKLKVVDATKVVVGGLATKSTEDTAKDFLETKKYPPQRRSKKVIIAAIVLSAVFLSIVVVVVVLVIVPMLLDGNKESDSQSSESSSVLKSQSPTISPTMPSYGTFSTIKSQVVDDYGRPIRLSGLNW